ncbi:MAG: DedA family protein [Planctomycetes bacterium]|nr:DedA family protein [Planctomycetota bacterium]
MVERFIAFFLALSGWWVTGTVFLLAATESALFIGLFLPGEIAVILGGVLASRGSASIWLIVPAAVLGAIVGDSLGYVLGKRFGAPFLKRKFGPRWQRVESFMQRHGASAVFFGKFSAFLRAVVPAAAGAAHIPYRKFLFWNVIGCVIWGAGFALLGYFAGESYEKVMGWGGRIGAIIIGGVVLMGIVLYVVHRRRRARQDAVEPGKASERVRSVRPSSTSAPHHGLS